MEVIANISEKSTKLAQLIENMHWMGLWDKILSKIKSKNMLVLLHMYKLNNLSENMLKNIYMWF